MYSLQSLQRQFNIDLTKQIELIKQAMDSGLRQIDTMTGSRMAEAGQLANKTIDLIKKMESDALDRIDTLAWCATEELQVSANKAIENIRFLGFKIFKSGQPDTPEKIFIVPPIESSTSLAKDTKPETKAKAVMDAYGELAKLAWKTHCHLRGRSST